MTTPIWPPSLPLVWTNSGTIQQETISTDASDGSASIPTAFRRLSRVPGSVNQITWTFLETEYKSFVVFWRDALLYGQKWFYMTMPTAMGIQWCMVRCMDEVFTAAMTGNRKWDVSVTVEIRERPIGLPISLGGSTTVPTGYLPLPPKVGFGGSDIGPIPPPPAYVDGKKFRYFMLHITKAVVDGGKPWPGNDGSVRVAEMRYFFDSVYYPMMHMTGYSTPSPVVVRGSAPASEDQAVWHAFDGSMNNTYASDPDSGIATDIIIDFGEGNEISPTSVQIAPDLGVPLGYWIVDFEILASNVGSFNSSSDGTITSFGVYTGLTDSSWNPNIYSSFALTPPPA